MALVVGSLLENAALTAPHMLAATIDNQELTYGDLYEGSIQMANVFHDLELGVGKRCMVWSDNSLPYLKVFAGLAFSGAVFVPIVASLNADEVVKIADYIQPSAIITDYEHAKKAREISEARKIPLLLFNRKGQFSDQEKYTDLDQLSDTAPTVFKGAGPSEEDLHAIFLTSGSTGTQKGVMLNHRTNWLRVFAGVGPHLPAGGPGMVCMFPLTHFAGWHFVTLTWSRLRAIHLVEKADALSLLRAVEHWKANELYCIPAVWHRIFDALDSGLPFDLSSLQYANTGTSRTPPDLLHKIKKYFPGTSTTVSYGTTEVPTIATLRDEELFGEYGHGVGLPAPGCIVRLADDGEICVRSDLVMQGYYNLPEETSASLKDGWYHTGDIGSLYNGRLTVTGRKKEAIRSGGEWIAPSEVDIALLEYPGVVDVGTTGVADPVWGEIVTAFISMEDGAPAPSVVDLKAFLTGRLASFKHPRRVEFIDKIPRTDATGQVQRKKLQELVSS